MSIEIENEINNVIKFGKNRLIELQTLRNRYQTDSNKWNVYNECMIEVQSFINNIQFGAHRKQEIVQLTFLE
jgi:hypothetical protein